MPAGWVVPAGFAGEFGNEGRDGPGFSMALRYWPGHRRVKEKARSICRQEWAACRFGGTHVKPQAALWGYASFACHFSFRILFIFPFLAGSDAVRRDSSVVFLEAAFLGSFVPGDESDKLAAKLSIFSAVQTEPRFRNSSRLSSIGFMQTSQGLERVAMRVCHLFGKMGSSICMTYERRKCDKCISA